MHFIPIYIIILDHFITPLWNNLHESHCALASLNEYKHLHWIFQLCHVHVSWNIKDTVVPESVRNKMHSLISIEHNNFDGCLCDIVILCMKVER